MNTMLSCSIAGPVVVFLKGHVMKYHSKTHIFNLGQMCNGVCAGLVGITANCDCVEPWQACIIGFISGLFFVFGSWILEKLHIDDPVDAIPCHFFCGLWGIIATGIFSNQSGLIHSEFEYRYEYFAYKVCGAFCIIGWAGSLSAIYFSLVKLLGLLRVEKAVEIAGIDICYLGGLNSTSLAEIRMFYELHQLE